jgi:hypothetical protein
MSAFLCSDKHISAVVHFINVNFSHWRTIGADLPTTDDPQGVGRVLYAANLFSVDTRYPDKATEELVVWRYKSPVAALDVVSFLKALDCLEYQSCEPENWEGSRAHRVISWARGCAIAMLPGYDKAPWGID